MFEVMFLVMMVMVMVMVMGILRSSCWELRNSLESAAPPPWGDCWGWVGIGAGLGYWGRVKVGLG